MLENITTSVSGEFEEGKRTISNKPPISITDWREAALWLKKAKFILADETPTHVIYYAQSTKKDNEFTLDFVHAIENKEYSSFDEYFEEKYGAFHKVRIFKATAKSDEWQMQSKCQCKYFFKNNMCRHLLGLALKTKVCKLPRTAITEKLVNKIPRGRKHKSLPALTKPKKNK